MIESLLFFISGSIAVVAMGFMIYTRNVIHGAYGLATILLSLAALFVLLNASYLAVVQLFMYAGGVVVLLVFGIMITNRKSKGAPLTSHRSIWMSCLTVGALLFIILQLTFDENFLWNKSVFEGDQTKLIGKVFLTDQLVAFELIAVLLLSVLVGAAFLAKKSSSNE